MKDYEMLSKIHFDKQAKIYDQKNTIYYSKEGKISCADIAKYLENYEYDNLLDVGTGTGYLIELLNKQKSASYFGLDLSDEMIKIAKNKKLPNTIFLTGKANSLPFPDNYFDVLTCSQSFHHYPYPKEAMAEAFRVLKPNGIYILSDTGIGGIAAWIDNNIIFPLMKSGDYFTTNKNGISKMMIEAKFNVIAKYQIKRFIYTVVGEKPLIIK